VLLCSLEKFSSEYAARPVLGGSLATSPPDALRKTAFDSPRLDDGLVILIYM
jgi:hypothetical protein